MRAGMERARGTRRRSAGLAGLIGAALLAWGLMQPSDKGPSSEWQPVNGQIASAIEGEENKSAEKERNALEAVSSPGTVVSAVVQPSPQGAGLVPEVSEPVSVRPAPAASPALAADAGAAAPAVSKSSGLLDLNKATVEQLDALPGIGPAKAKAIVQYRESQGLFRSVQDLQAVKGIGIKLLAKLRPLVTVE